MVGSIEATFLAADNDDDETMMVLSEPIDTVSNQRQSERPFGR